MKGFHRLPPEIRLEIVKRLVDHWAVDNVKDDIATYASVCREWQAVIERHTFANLRLTLNRLPSFGRFMTLSRRRCLTEIRLQVELPVYANDPCEAKESWQDKVDNNRLFTDTLAGLFEILNEWKEDEVVEGGLHLQLGVSSKSDLRNTHFELWQRRRWNLRDIGERRFGDSYIDFIGQDEESARPCVLKPVYVVTSFQTCPLIRRSVVPAAYADIIIKLPRLRTLSMDVIKERKLSIRRYFFNQFGDMLARWPQTLDSLEVTANTHCSWRQLPHDGVSEGDTGQVLCQQLREFSTQLKSLRISNLVRVRELLKPVWPASDVDDKEPFIPNPQLPIWTRLEVLKVSYGSIYYKQEWYKEAADVNEHDDTVRFRQCASLAAARLADRMPRLKEFCLVQRPMMWAGKHALEYHVQEEGDDGRLSAATLTWTSTFAFKPWQRTLEAWTDVCARHAKAKLKVEVRRIEGWQTDGTKPLNFNPSF